MKKIINSLLLALITVVCYAADGDVFTAKTEEGVEMTFRILSETEKKCEVGTGMRSSAISREIEKVTIPSTINGYKVVSIGNYAFNQTWLIDVIISNSVTQIGERAFSCTSITSIEIPSSVKYIGEGAFDTCRGLTSLTIPNSVTSIGDFAFSDCRGLTSLMIGNSVTDIGSYAFTDCRGLTSLTIPNSVTSIGDGAFRFCSSLKSIVFPNSVTCIGSAVFHGCSSLAAITVNDGNPVYDSRENCNAVIETVTNRLVCGCNVTVIPNSVTSIGEGAFRGCNFTSIEIPNSVTSIGSSAFANCSFLTSVEIPNSVKIIAFGAFQGCPLTSIDISKGVEHIGSWAFHNCPLKSITVQQNIPQSIINSNSDGINHFLGEFEKEQYDNTLLLIPSGSLKYYQTANVWRQFKNIKEIDMPGGVADVYVDDSPFTVLTNNKKIIGYYSSGEPFGAGNASIGGRSGSYKVFNVFNKDFLKLFLGNNLTYLRFSLVDTEIQNVKIWIGTDPNNYIYSQDVTNVNLGWNEIKLERPFDISESSLSNLYVGVEWMQKETKYPIAVLPFRQGFRTYLNQGATGVLRFVKSFCEIDGAFFELDDRICFQFLLEGDKIPEYAYYLERYWNNELVRQSNTYKLEQPLQINYEYIAQMYDVGYYNDIDVACHKYQIDDNVFDSYKFVFPNPTVGIHTVYHFIQDSVGNILSNIIKAPIYIYAQSLSRQKYYYEVATATWCPYTSRHLNDYKNFATNHEDVSMCFIHWDDILSCSAVKDYKALFYGSPQIRYNRNVNFQVVESDALYPRFYEPVFADVHICAKYNKNIRKLMISVKGNKVHDFDLIEGAASLTVLLTEDDVIAPQYDGETYKYTFDYQHQAVLRANVSDVWGDPVVWNGDTYEMNYTVTLNEEWDAENMKIIAFLTKPYTGDNMEENYVMNCNDFEVKDAAFLEAEIYQLTYMIDGEVYKTVSMAEGTVITPEPAPVREGYTFEGWQDLPSAMPDHDVMVTGTFTKIPTYQLIYMLDGEIYKQYEVLEGTEITPEPAPVREGYTFDGWQDLPSVMPDHDVTVTGSFTKLHQTYQLIYMLDGEIYKQYEVLEGTEITPEPEPVREGYTFDGWQDLPSVMPDHDVMVTGSFTKIPLTTTVTVSAAGYATFYDSSVYYKMPSDLTAHVVEGVSDGEVLYNALGSSVIPAGVAVVLEAEKKEAATYTLIESLDDVSLYTGPNLLYGSDTDTRVSAPMPSRFYRLSYGAKGTYQQNVFGWYWGAPEGAVFNIEAHHAWLAIPTTTALKNFLALPGFEESAHEENDDIVFDLAGRRIDVSSVSSVLSRGVYIINGKKVFVK